ncbi:MAG: RNA pseudouridine synthase [Bacteroides sp.]|nr:RNA pseudouridine synthase [Bacteroides sp.]
MCNKENRFHPYLADISQVELPARFTYPFCYKPHPLSVLAAEEVKEYLSKQTQWHEELSQGKMFGVLVVENEQKQVGFIAAFSGILASSNNHPYFVPPVYDLLNPDGFFKPEEEAISNINRQIKHLENQPQYLLVLNNLRQMSEECKHTLTQERLKLKQAKALRDERRQKGNLSVEEEAALIKESQFQKAEFKRIEKAWNQRMSQSQQAYDTYKHAIDELKQERRMRSSALQKRLFEQFVMLNYHGEEQNLCDIFADTVQLVPPAGAGECAAPKLLQYAYKQGWKPLAMAEFWWGNSPKSEIRHHGQYYPSCKGKCEPILKHMLKGLDVEPNPMIAQQQQSSGSLDVVYEDEWIAVINKPANLLSVPAKDEGESVYALAKKQFPQADGPLIVHRLDFATSGILVITKTKEAHKHLQEQFANRTIEKRYVALLKGRVAKESGVIDLPLSLNRLDRPHQMVDYEQGKQAITRYQILESSEDTTRIAFYPLTGRTHQLRVHAAHPDGLHCPIIGDDLYGTPSTRLFLHAEYIRFRHPMTKETISFTIPAPF